MIKEDNVGDTNRLYLIYQEVDSPHSETCKMRWRAGSFYKIRNIEQGREKYELSDMIGAT